MSASLQAGQQRRGFWLRHVHRWHWISSALCLLGMLLFAATGFTLNHAGALEGTARVSHQNAQLPAGLRQAVARGPASGKHPLSPDLRAWVRRQLDVDVGLQAAEWLELEVYLSMPRPGGDAWLSIDRESGRVEYENTDRGWVAYLNDLHKGRHAGSAWAWFIDVFALACVVFSVTGLILLKLHAGQRRSTWPLVGAGVLIPLLLALLFIH